jgi:hypothetical protein
MINIMKFINVRVFIASLLIGLIAVYIYVPEMRRIYVYPTPENIELLQYKDKTDTCFEYKQTEVGCSTSGISIFKVPVQT